MNNSIIILNIHVGPKDSNRVEMDPTKVAPLLFGPGGAVAALLLFIGYLIKELQTSRTDRDKFMNRYEDMREQRDEFRFLAGDAVRAGKRSAQTAVVLSRATRKTAEAAEDDGE